MINKVMFDASIHLGQFDIQSEDRRKACKQSQVSLAGKEHEGIVGVCTFMEVARVDNTIWQLPRDMQDVFYPFMDEFHSVKRIERVEPIAEDLEMALQIHRDIGLGISNALSCATAIRLRISSIHTVYPALLEGAVRDYMLSRHKVQIMKPVTEEEAPYSEVTLESSYNTIVKVFGEARIDLLSIMRSAQD